ncbi:MAG: GerMN domain-containing protein [Syntrophorhabdaceae bacterium]|nr:GerMN domain-containing protein [Syntrophorhabdaceae bacterium]
MWRKGYDIYTIKKGEKAKRSVKIALFLFFTITALLAATLAIYVYFMKIEPQYSLPPLVLDRVVLFVPTEQGRLIEKQIPVKMNLTERKLGEVILRELKRDGVLPERVNLQDFAIDDQGTVYLNLSREIYEQTGGPQKEINMVYSIVNSYVANFKDARQVQILVEGKPVETIDGVVYLHKPIAMNKTLMEE